MIEPQRIIDYFAHLAPVGRGPRWDHSPAPGDLVWLDRPPEITTSGATGVLEIESSVGGLRDLWAAARVHGARGFLRVGWLFITGTVVINGSDTAVFLPVASMPARLRSRGDDYQHFTIVAESEPTIPATAVADHSVREALEAQLEGLLASWLIGRGRADLAAIKAFITSFCDAAGLPGATGYTAPDEPVAPGGTGLRVVTGMAVYTARDRTAINLESTLLEWRQERLAHTAFAKVYGSSESIQSAVTTDTPGVVANSLPLNPAQRSAVLAARHLPVTVLSGPPGTGKTHTAVALAMDQIAHGHSVLIAAQSDDAVDAIEQILGRFASPRHVRFGSHESRRRVADDLSDGLAAKPSHTADSSLARLEGMEETLRNIDHRLRRRLELEEDFANALSVRMNNSWCLADAPGLAGVIDSELLTTRLLGWFNREPGGVFGSLRRRLGDARMANILQVAPQNLAAVAPAAVELVKAEQVVHRAQATAEQDIARAFEEYERIAAEVRSLFGGHLEDLRSSKSWSPGVARAVGSLATALRAGRGARRQMLRSLDSTDALQALPLWIGTLADIDDTLPIRPALFDMVIIDEASQVNQVRAATSLARGGRAVIIGDPRQLRHVSFVGDAAMESAAVGAGMAHRSPLLDVRRNSVFDVAAGAAPVLQLTEHYRGAPHLIAFSNRQFYKGRLQMMTEHPATSSADVISVDRVSGARDATGVINAEIDYIIDRIESGGASGSVGVVTPFRRQADGLERAALGRLTPHLLERLDLRIGTVHGFQGNERDHVFISVGLDPSDLGPLRFVEDPNLFNVMVTRARDSVTVVTSLDPDHLPEGLLSAYLRHSLSGLPGPASRPSASGWQADVAAALRPYGLPMWEGFPVGGHLVDIAVGEGTAAVGVECAIHPDGVDAHIERHLALRRAGWDLVTALESHWLARPGDAADAIARRVMSRRWRRKG